MNQLEKLFNEKGISYDDYRYNLNMAHLVATMADGYASKADSLLRQVQYRMENKHLFTRLRSLLNQLLKRVDNMPDNNKSDAFFKCSDYLTKVADKMGKKHIDDEGLTKLLSFIQNNFKDGK